MNKNFKNLLEYLIEDHFSPDGAVHWPTLFIVTPIFYCAHTNLFSSLK